MVESIIYFSIGFLCAVLIGVAVIPLIHSRAVRLTIRRLEDSMPQSMAEIQADKDLLRAEFAMSARRLEMSVEQIRDKATSQLAELGKKGDAINRLKIERDAQNVEVIALKTQVEALKERFTTASNKVKAESDVAPLVPKELPTAEEARSGEPARDPDAGRDSSDQGIGMAREGSDFSAGLGAVEPSIRVFSRPSDFKNAQVVNDRPSFGRRTFRSLARFFIAALIGVGATFAWQSYGDEAKEMVRAWTPSLGWLAFVSTTKSPPAPAPAAAATSPELMQQLEAMVHDLTAVRHSVEQLADKQEQMAWNIATLQTLAQDIKKNMSPSPSSQAVPIPPSKSDE